MILRKILLDNTGQPCLQEPKVCACFLTCLSLCSLPAAVWVPSAIHIPPPSFSSAFMKEKGFLDAGYNYITLGGIGYLNNSAPGGNITRNASG